MPEDLDNLHKSWDEIIKPALEEVENIEQPLLPFLNEFTLNEVKAFLKNSSDFKSVQNLRFNKEKAYVLNSFYINKA